MNRRPEVPLIATRIARNNPGMPKDALMELARSLAACQWIEYDGVKLDNPEFQRDARLDALEAAIRNADSRAAMEIIHQMRGGQ